MAYYRCGGGVPSSVKTLPTYKTASGSVATFETDMTENLISCVCEIPDTGASAVNGMLCGSNYWSNDKAVSDSNTPTVYIQDEWLHLKTGGNMLSYNIGINSQMTLSMIAKSNENCLLTIRAYYDDGSYSAVINSGLTANTEINLTGVTTMNKKISFFRSVYTDNKDVFLKNVMLNTGDVLIPFEVFNGTDFSVNFGSTILGGTVDVVTGKIIDGSDVVSYAQNTVEIPTINGTNNLFADTGDISEAKYILSVGEALRQG